MSDEDVLRSLDFSAPEVTCEAKKDPACENHALICMTITCPTCGDSDTGLVCLICLAEAHLLAQQGKPLCCDACGLHGHNWNEWVTARAVI